MSPSTPSEADFTARQAPGGAGQGVPDDVAWFILQLPWCAAVYDARARCLLANPALLRWLGRTETDVQGRTLFELWPPGVAAREAADLDLVLAGQRLEQQENRHGPRGEAP